MSDNWISVDDEMPEKEMPIWDVSQWVLIQSDQRILRKARYDFENNIWLMDGWNDAQLSFKEVKYWQPLPKPRIEE